MATDAPLANSVSAIKRASPRPDPVNSATDPSQCKVFGILHSDPPGLVVGVGEVVDKLKDGVSVGRDDRRAVDERMAQRRATGDEIDREHLLRRIDATAE